MNKEIIKRRIKTIRYRLTKEKISFFIVTKPANVSYTTGFSGDDSWTVITKSRVYLLTDSRYTEQAQKECPNCMIIERTGPMAEEAAKLVKKLKSVRTITVEESTSLANSKRLKKVVKARFKSAAKIIESVRSIKDNSEISAIKTAASIATKALRQTLRHVKAGITENELAGMFDFQIRRLGAISSFDTIVAFGPNASRPHHQPGTRKLKKRDTILIDFGAKYKGYCSDITRCFAIGKPSTLYQKVYDVVQAAQVAALKTVKASAKIAEVDAAAREVISKSSLPVYGHGSGHGIGLEIHELPLLAPKSKGRLESGQVITIEPAIYMPGKLGVRIEDDILVTKSGYEVLTRNCPRSFLLSTRQR